MFLSLFEEFDTFPELYGTCGELYVVEELQPLDIPHLLGTVGIMSVSKRIEYKEDTLRFGRRRFSFFELFLGLHRNREGEEDGTGLCLWQPSYL